MMLYLDDDIADPRLAHVLRQAAFDVQLPVEVGLSGRSDVVHFTHAVLQTRPMMTKDYQDYKELHDLAMALQGRHPGIIAIREDNDQRRDMKPSEMVRALNRLLAAGVPIANQYIILNQWR